MSYESDCISRVRTLTRKNVSVVHMQSSFLTCVDGHFLNAKLISYRNIKIEFRNSPKMLLVPQPVLVVHPNNNNNSNKIHQHSVSNKVYLHLVHSSKVRYLRSAPHSKVIYLRSEHHSSKAIYLRSAHHNKVVCLPSVHSKQLALRHLV